MKLLTLLVLFLFAPSVAAGPPGAVAPPSPAVHPGPGEVEAPAVVRVTFDTDAVDDGVVLVDATGARVPGHVEVTAFAERTFHPAVSPLPDGQYTVDFPGLETVRTFTVGPDVYPPVLISPLPAAVGRDEPIRLRFSEALDLARFEKDDMEILQVTATGTRRVTGHFGLDREGTRMTFTPVGWPGFTPGADFVVRVRDGALSDLAGNILSRVDVAFTGATVESDADSSRVPETVFWSSRRELGMIDVAAGLSSREARIGDPAEIVLDPRVDLAGHGYAYGVDPRGQAVVVVSTRTGAVLQRVPVRRPVGIAIHPSGERLFVTTKRGEVLALDSTRPIGGAGNEFAVVGSARVGRRPGGVAVSPDGRLVAAVSRRERTVTLLDAETLGIRTVVPLDGRPEDAAFLGGSPSRLLVTGCGRRRADGKVFVIDPAKEVVIESVGGFSTPGRIAACGGRAWVVDRRAREVVAMDVAGGIVTRGVALPAGNRPVDVTVAPAGEELLFVVNGRQNRITVLSEATGGVVTTIRAKGALAVATWGER